ncbi:hypothetical protein GCM10009795_013980 [Nocardioides hankookensis]
MLEHARFVAVPLTPDVAALDYDAYVASPDVIRVHSDGRWPVDGFTLEDELREVRQHQVDHEADRSFAFALLTPSGDRSLGCVYVNRLHDYLSRVDAPPGLLAAFRAPSAMVTFWLRQDEQTTGLADVVVAAVDAWLSDEWPLERALFRVLPAEHSSRSALERHGLDRVELALPGETRPYLWFEARL